MPTPAYGSFYRVISPGNGIDYRQDTADADNMLVTGYLSARHRSLSHPPCDLIYGTSVNERGISTPSVCSGNIIIEPEVTELASHLIGKAGDSTTAKQPLATDFLEVASRITLCRPR